MTYTPPDEMILIDVQNAARRVLRFSEGLDYERFLNDELTQSAILHQLMVLGEAVKRLSVTFREAHGEIPWPRIAGMRDVLIHRYDEVDFKVVWDVVQHDLSNLLAAIAKLVPKEPDA